MSIKVGEVQYAVTNTLGSTSDINCKLYQVFASQNYGILLTKRICWEIVGRICHLIEDSGVPAHAHDDDHPSSDYYETQWLPNHYMEKNWTHARNQGGLININNKSCPLRYALYTTNQVADRFPSDDEDGDYSYSTNTNNCDYYQSILFGIYDELNTQNVPITHFGNNPPSGLMQTIFDYSYVYSIRSVAGFLWYVYNQFGIQSNLPPIATGFYPNPPIIHGSNGSITFVLSQGNNCTFYWRSVNTPNDVTFLNGIQNNEYWETDENYLSILWPISLKDNKAVGEWKLYCKAHNFYGWSDSLRCPPIIHSSNIGCPWLYVIDNDTIYREDNNVLNKSEFQENIGQDITDRYVLSKSPGKIDNIITLSLAETTIDTSYINSVKLYAVDHPVGTLICVTEDNQIAIFDSASVISVSRANLNGNDITENIQFHIVNKIITQCDTLDHVYAKYPDNSYGNAIIANLNFNPLQINYQKNWDGFININSNNGNFTSNFARRENKSITAIPITGMNGNPMIDDINIDWYKGNDIRYIATANLDYSNFTITELPLFDAYNSFQDSLLYNLTNIDDYYGVVDSSTSIILKFYSSGTLSTTSVQHVTDYVFEVNGRIGSYLSNIKKLKLNKPIIKKNNISIAFKNKLNNNYPNPFNPITKINYSIEKQGLVTLRIYDILGREIKTLVNEIKNPGEYIVEFNGSNLSSGVYFYRFETNGFTDIKKMLLIK